MFLQILLKILNEKKFFWNNMKIDLRGEHALFLPAQVSLSPILVTVSRFFFGVGTTTLPLFGHMIRWR